MAPSAREIVWALLGAAVWCIVVALAQSSLESELRPPIPALLSKETAPARLPKLLISPCAQCWRIEGERLTRTGATRNEWIAAELLKLIKTSEGEFALVRCEKFQRDVLLVSQASCVRL